MASQPSEPTQYLQRPLYVYDLPPELLQTLVLAPTKDSFQRLKAGDDTEDQRPLERVFNDDSVSTSTSCTLCKATFRDVSEQRQHVRSDLHRYNLKLKLKGLPSVDEATFVKQIGDLDESISGSDSSDSGSEEESNDNTTLSALLKKQAKLSGLEKDERVVGRRVHVAGNAPMLWMTSPKLPDDIGLGIYRALLTNNEQQRASLELIDIIRQKQIEPIRGKHSGNAQNTNQAVNSPHFFLCMIGGGHFAAAVIGLAPEVRKGPGGIEERHAVVKAHKTFHRYTTRRKQGGSQSANDNSKGNAHSVGSSIRRANEAALILDVRNVLAEWKTMIDSAELVFIRATGSQNRRTLFGPYDGQVLDSRDPRVRGFPFSTRRATQNELIRAFQELTRLKVSNLVEVEEKPSEDSSKAKTVTKPKPAPPKLTEEQESALLHTSQIQNLIRRSKAPGLLLYLNKNSLPADFWFYPPNEGNNHHAPTSLHMASANSAAAVVTALLTKAQADPTVLNDDGKTPYDIAGDVKTRDAFRIARYQLGETAYDWQAGHVPAALSPQEVEARSQREQSESNAAEAERRRADLQKIQKEEEERKVGKIEKKAGVGKALGSGILEKSWTEKREEEMRGLSPEMQQKIERERRARAAEARFKKLPGGGSS